MMLPIAGTTTSHAPTVPNVHKLKNDDMTVHVDILWDSNMQPTCAANKLGPMIKSTLSLSLSLSLSSPQKNRNSPKESNDFKFNPIYMKKYKQL